MKELLERLRGATGADRELDARIHVACVPNEAGMVHPGSVQPWQRGSSHDAISQMDWGAWATLAASRGSDLGMVANHHLWPAYTASLDSALALVERALPSHNCIDLSKEPPNNSGYAGGWEATISRNYVNEGHWAAVGHAPTAPLALLIALLGALGAESEASAQSTDEDRKTNNNPSLSKPNQ